MSDENPMKESLDKFNKLKEERLEDIKKSKDVEEKILTEEEAKQEPENNIYIHMTETIIKMLSSEELINMFKLLEEKGIDKDVIGILINIIAFITTNASYDSILFYDNLLKNELGKQFDNIGTFVNKMRSDVNGIVSACEVYKTKIGNIENKLMLNKIK